MNDCLSIHGYFIIWISIWDIFYLGDLSGDRGSTPYIDHIMCHIPRKQPNTITQLSRASFVAPRAADGAAAPPAPSTSRGAQARPPLQWHAAAPASTQTTTHRQNRRFRSVLCFSLLTIALGPSATRCCKVLCKDCRRSAIEIERISC
eukprot:6185103-Pleurochrysis_carterae.AAC.2